MAESKKANHGKKRKKPSIYQINEVKANKRAKRSALALRIFLHTVFGLVFTLGAAVLSLAAWYQATFNISFSDLLAVMSSPIGGTGEGTLSDIFTACLPPVLVLLALYVAAALLLWKKTPKRRVMRIVSAILCVVFLLSSCTYAVFAFKIDEYLLKSSESTELYENEYVDPSSVKITDSDGNARNLIYIYLESMETTYASVEDGGNQEGKNYMPKLTELADKNISFSDGEGLGGFRSISGTGWTMGALMGTTSGVPFSLAVFGENSNNSLGKDGTFLDSMVTLGDILEEKGYTQEFLCGSDASFGGRRTYFTVHGNYKIFDYFTAKEEGYIADDYKVFWGFEDEILFEIAKDEVTELAKGDKPFNLTMLTVDPHHVGGYECDLCYDGDGSRRNDVANVITCQDNQISSFVEWCKGQDFYENTTIVIVGDHPRMDSQLIGTELEIYDRPMYNCIINSVSAPYSDTVNRTYTSLDMFPTTLAAMGFEIEGERLGLGTNMFSPIPTLCEKHGGGKEGYDWLDTEVSRYSQFYDDTFVGKKD